MGWRPAHAIVDVDINNRDADVILHPETIYSQIELSKWKVFLLGFAKYGPKDCWNPEKPLRGLPERKNDYLYTKFGDDNYEFSERLNEVFTYYTLEELKDINLDEPVGLPENPENWGDYEYCIELEMKVADEWYDQFGDAYHTQLGFYTVDTLEKAVRSEKPIEINIENQNFGTNYREDLIEKTGGKTKLRARPRKKRHYAPNFEGFVELLTELYENKNFGLKQTQPCSEIEESDIRLIFGQML